VALSIQSWHDYKNSVFGRLLITNRLNEAQEISVAYETVWEIDGLK
jgi:hypothetical protein